MTANGFTYLCEYAGLVYSNGSITEEVAESTTTKSTDKGLFIEGIFMQGNIKNQNGRMYSVDVLKEAMERYDQKFIKRNIAFGEMDHPLKGGPPVVSMKNASHMITELKVDGDNIVGRAKVLKGTTAGDILAGLIENGCGIGVSSRGLGKIRTTKDCLVVEKLLLITPGDIVSNPSAPEAMVQGLSEHADWVWNSGISEETLEQVHKDVHMASSSELAETKLKAFTKLLDASKNI